MKEAVELLDFVITKIHPDDLAENYFHLVDLYKSDDNAARELSVLHLYLSGEQHLIRQNYVQLRDIYAFRQTTFSRYQDLNNTEQFGLIQKSNSEQQEYLKKLFINKVIDSLLAENQIDQPPPGLETEYFDTETGREILLSLYRSADDQNQAHAVMQNTYNKLSFHYSLLEGFFVIPLLIPTSLRTIGQLEWINRHQASLALADKTNQLTVANRDLSREIDEFHQMEEELKESESLLNKIIESAMDAMVLLNENGEIDYWSAQSERLTGRSRSELIGKKFSTELLVADSIAGFEKEVRDFTESQESFEGKKRFESRLLIRNDDSIEVEISMTSVRLKDRFILSAFIRDISQRKDYEREILDARDKAEEASAAKLTFLSMMSHEIRTPLNAVIGTSQLLLEENPRKDQLENLNILKFSAENLLSIINDILDFNKVEEGKMVLEDQPFNLELLCENIVNSFTPVAKEKGINISFKNKLKRINLVSGDETRLSQVLINLFGNAVKFTSSGSVVLSAELINLNDRIGEVKFEIIDTGIGISQNKIESIFDRFTQVHEYSKEENYGGTGLGLPIAKNIVRLMGGDLLINSIPGLGSTFYFSIKLPIPYKEGLQTKNDNKGKFDIITNKNILIVEDHKINQIVASKFLKKYQCTIDIAENGREAVDIIASGETSYDLILMDLEMPVMNGYDAAIAIRKLETGSQETPIVALSANALLDVSKKVLEAGMNGYISKPFEAQHFYAQIADNIKA